MTSFEAFDPDEFSAFEHAGWQDITFHYDVSFAQLTSQAVEPLLDAIEARKGTRLLDIATGPGYVAAVAAERGASVIGIDFSAAMVLRAKQRYPDIEFVEGNAEMLPFANESFDAVAINFGLLHFGRSKQALAESHRVLRRGGKIGFTVWTMPEEAVGFGIVLQALQAHGNWNVSLPPGPSAFHFSSPQECCQALLEVGFLNPTTKQIPLIWQLSSPDELFKAMQEGTVRTGRVLQAQTEEALDAIHTEIKDAVKDYKKGAIIELPMPALLATSLK